MHISPISEEREKSSYTKWQNGYIPRFEGYSRYFTDIAHAYFDYVITVASSHASLLVPVFTDSDNADDTSTNVLVTYVVIHSFSSLPVKCS